MSTAATSTVSTPGVGELAEVVAVLGSWQRGDAPLQLHPGDLGWFWRHGAEATSAAVRVWRSRDAIVAIGLLDGADVLRLTVAPHLRHDPATAERIVDDLADPGTGVLASGPASVEVPNGSRVQGLLDARGWRNGDAWTPLRCDLGAPVAPAPEPSGLRVEAVRPETAEDYAAIVRSAFGSTRFTLDRWRELVGGLPSGAADHLIGYDPAGTPTAAISTWSAGPGRTGLIEPMGVHADHRGRGYGRAICLAAAAALRARGCTTAEVCTESRLTAAVATYRSAGFVAQPERLDRTRTG